FSSPVTRTIMTARPALPMLCAAGRSDGHGARPPVDGTDARPWIRPPRRCLLPLPRPQPLVRVVSAHVLDEPLISRRCDDVVNDRPRGGDDLGGARPHEARRDPGPFVAGRHTGSIAAEHDTYAGNAQRGQISDRHHTLLG